jgi:hypothetical protein
VVGLVVLDRRVVETEVLVAVVDEILALARQRVG